MNLYRARHVAVQPRRTRRRVGTILPIAVAFTLLVAGIASADQVVNNIDSTVDPALETRAINAGGSTQVGFYVLASNTVPAGDASGCNATGSNPATMNLSVPAGVTATPSSVSFVGCGNTQNVMFSSNTPGSYTISVASVTGGKAGSLWDTAPASFTLVVNAVDSTPPVITANVAGTLGDNGWYTSDVSLSWTVTDAESAVTSTSGCGSVSINADQGSTDYTCSATSAGGSASKTVSIKRDSTAPTISGSAAPAPNGAGWNNSDVSVSFVCADSLSGLASCGPNQTLSGDGAGQSASGTAKDNAGNTASASVGNINIDKTPPSVSASASPIPNANGWNNGTVSVSFSGTDSLSGIDSCDAPVVLSGEGAGQSATGSCSDKAGNSASATASNINIDLTDPTVSASASPGPNANGWNNGSVTVSFSGSDSLSGIDSCDAPVVLSGEGAGQSATGSCSDKAGNSASATASGINIDKTAPTVSLSGGTVDGGVYYWGGVPSAPTCVGADGLSGLASCTVSGHGTTIGTHTVTATATDKAGNSATATATYQVLAWTLSGFYSPVDMGYMNTVKGGSTVPLKFQVFASSELTDPAVVKSFNAVQTSCVTGLETAPVEELSPAGSTTLRYDATSGHFIYNWKTPKLPGKCYQVTLTTNDGSTIVAKFQLK